VRRAGLAENASVRGTMVIKPYGYAIWEAIQRELDARIKATGHENYYFPLFVPASVLAQESELVEGFAPMDEVTSKLEVAVPEGESGAYHTLAGFVMARLGHIPHTADAFEWGGFRFEVVDMDGRRVDKVMVTRVPLPQPPPTAHPSPA